MTGYEQLLHWSAERGAGTLADFTDAHAWATGEEVSAYQDPAANDSARAPGGGLARRSLGCGKPYNHAAA